MNPSVSGGAVPFACKCGRGIPVIHERGVQKAVSPLITSRWRCRSQAQLSLYLTWASQRAPQRDGSAAPLDHSALSRCRPSWAPVTNFMHMHARFMQEPTQSRKASLNGLRNEVFGCASAWIVHAPKIDTTYGTGTVHQFRGQPWMGSVGLFSKCRDNCRGKNRKSKLFCARD